MGVTFCLVTGVCVCLSDHRANTHCQLLSNLCTFIMGVYILFICLSDHRANTHCQLLFYHGCIYTVCLFVSIGGSSGLAPTSRILGFSPGVFLVGAVTLRVLGWVHEYQHFLVKYHQPVDCYYQPLATQPAPSSSFTRLCDSVSGVRDIP